MIRIDNVVLIKVQVDDDGDDRRRDEGGSGGVAAGAGALGVPAQGMICI